MSRIVYGISSEGSGHYSMRNKIISITLLFLFILINNSFAISEVSLTQEERKLLSEGAIIVKETPSKGDGKTFEAIGIIEAKTGEVYRVLTDFEEYINFMPNVSDIKVLKKSSNSAVLNYTLGLPLGKVKKYRLKMTFKKSESIATLKWEMIDWPGIKQEDSIKDTFGSWFIKSYSEKEGYVLVHYHVYTDPGPVPFGLGWIIDILTEKSVPDVVKNTRERVYKIKSRMPQK